MRYIQQFALYYFVLYPSHHLLVNRARNTTSGDVQPVHLILFPSSWVCVSEMLCCPWL